MDPLHQPAQGCAELGIQIAEGLVHQKQLGPAHQCPGDGHTLELAAGKLGGEPVHALADAQQRSHFCYGLLDLLPGHMLGAQGKGDVIIHRQVGIQCVILEHHGHIPVLRRHQGSVPAIQNDFAQGGDLQTRDDPQQGGLTAAGGSQQHHKFTVLYGDVDMLQHHHTLVGHIGHSLLLFQQGLPLLSAEDALHPDERVDLQNFL